MTSDLIGGPGGLSQEKWALMHPAERAKWAAQHTWPSAGDCVVCGGYARRRVFPYWAPEDGRCAGCVADEVERLDGDGWPPQPDDDDGQGGVRVPVEPEPQSPAPAVALEDPLAGLFDEDPLAGLDTLPDPLAAVTVKPAGRRDDMWAPPPVHTAHTEGLPEHFSPSSADTFNKCPRKWQHKYRDRWPDPAGVDAVRGKAVHAVLERAVPQRVFDGPGLRQIMADVWTGVASSDEWLTVAADWDEAMVRGFKWEVKERVDRALELPATRDADVVATETRLEVDLAGVPFLGFVDRVDRLPGGVRQVDYKTGKHKPRYGESKRQQVRLYAAAWQEATGEKPAAGQLVFLGHDHGAVVEDVDVSPEAVDRAVAEHADLWARLQRSIDTGQFAPKPQTLCFWCPYLERCPAGVTEVVQRIEGGDGYPHSPGQQLLRQSEHHWRYALTVASEPAF